MCYVYIYLQARLPLQPSRRSCTRIPTWGIRGAKKKNTILYYILRLNMEYPRAYKWNIIEYPRIFNDIPFHLWASPSNLNIRIPHVGS